MKKITKMLIASALILGGFFLGLKVIFSLTLVESILIVLAYLSVVLCWIFWESRRTINTEDPKYYYMRDRD